MLRNPVIGLLTIVLLLVTINLVYLDILVFSTFFDEKDTEAPLQVVTPAVSVTPTQVALISPTISASVPEAPELSSEYYVPLGSGGTTSNQYVPLEGAEAYIDTSLYGPIKEATFEVFLRNPTGNGVTYAKLFNETDGHDVWFSEVSFVGGGISREHAKITLDSGNKLYRVYLKSTLAYDVYADSARIRIITQ